MDIITPARVRERIIHWADRDEQTGCLVSRYSVGSHGYAQIGWHEGGRRIVTLAHRALWIAERGPIPEGMTVDHEECHNRKCVEITHLRLLTNLDNARRNKAGRDWPLDGTCIRGHHPTWWRPKGPTRSKGYCHGCRMEAQAKSRGATLKHDYTQPKF